MKGNGGNCPGRRGGQYSGKGGQGAKEEIACHKEQIAHKDDCLFLQSPVHEKPKYRGCCCVRDCTTHKHESSFGLREVELGGEKWLEGGGVPVPGGRGTGKAGKTE